MKLIVGLGNPGEDYDATRHNVGWLVLDHLSEEWKAEGWRKDAGSLTVAARLGQTAVRLLKPQTYMNLSGAALRPYLRRPTWSPSTDLLVVVDDVALPLGSMRLRANGSAGGHNGLKSIEQAVGHREYARLRIGIRPTDDRVIHNLSDFVLGPLNRAERAELADQLPRYTGAIETWAREGIHAAMSRFNRTPAPPAPPAA